MKGSSRSNLALNKSLEAFKDPEKYPDLYISSWRMIPQNRFFEERGGTMNLGRIPWEWFYNIQDGSKAYNFRTGTSVQFRESGNKWFTVGASLENVKDNIRTSLFPLTDLMEQWEFGKWFRVQWHIHRSLDPSEGYLETWIDDIQIGEIHYAKTAYNDLADPNKAHTLDLKLTNYITSVEPEFFDSVPIISFVDDVVVSDTYVPLDYTVGEQEEEEKEDNRFLLLFMILLLVFGIVLMPSFWKSRS